MNDITTATLTPFHLAFPVRDLDETRAFYIDVLGCEQGRSSHTWTDFSLFGHQMSAHLRPGEINHSQGMVDGAGVPIPHFGVVLSMENWNALADRLSGRVDIDWIMEPTRRFVGEPGEQATLFIRDPSGNALEFKGYASADAIFAT